IFFGFFLLGYIITKINNPSAPDSFGYGDWYFYFGLLTPAALFIGFIYKIKQILARKTRQKDIKKITDKHL
ncbi:MAG: hypothetical protein LBD05_02220, partial [Mycoplasmataceae bacterium]|nr:hypothetical protein [Mycoplasmataceae bacterium]